MAAFLPRLVRGKGGREGEREGGREDTKREGGGREEIMRAGGWQGWRMRGGREGVGRASRGRLMKGADHAVVGEFRLAAVVSITLLTLALHELEMEPVRQ